MRCISVHKSQRRLHKCTCYREAPPPAVHYSGSWGCNYRRCRRLFIPTRYPTVALIIITLKTQDSISKYKISGWFGRQMYLKQSWRRFQSLGGIIAPSHTGQTASASKMCENRAHWFDCATVCWDFPSQLIRQRWTMLCRPIKGRWTLERTRDNLTFGQIQSSRLHAFNILWNGHFSGLEPDNYSFYRKINIPQ